MRLFLVNFSSLGTPGLRREEFTELLRSVGDKVLDNHEGALLKNFLAFVI